MDPKQRADKLESARSCVYAAAVLITAAMAQAKTCGANEVARSLLAASDDCLRAQREIGNITTKGPSDAAR